MLRLWPYLCHDSGMTSFVVMLSYLTVGAAARVLGVDPSTVSRWIVEGKLVGHQPKTAPGERQRALLWEPEVLRLKKARDLMAGRPAAAGETVTCVPCGRDHRSDDPTCLVPVPLVASTDA